MNTVIPLGDRVLHKYVLEVRYDFGYIYWDRRGRIVNEIARSWPEWAHESVQPTACQLRRADQNCAMTFGVASFDLSQTQDIRVDRLMALKDFALMAQDLYSVVERILELREFSRLGFREWILYPTSGRESADSLLCELKHFRIESVWGPVHAPTFTAEFERKDKMVRASLSSFEQMISVSPSLLQQERIDAKALPRGQRRARIEAIKAKHKIDSHPQTGILLDIDASVESPDLASGQTIAEFIISAGSEFDTLQKDFLERI